MPHSSRTPWPPLPLDEWQSTRDTLQLWTQIVGKVRLAHEPLANHWWNVPLYVTARGLTTSLIPHRDGVSFQIDFDFRGHRLDIVTTTGETGSMALKPMPVADFYAEFVRLLQTLGVGTTIWPVPVEIENAIPFADDRVHATYDSAHAQRFWLALVEIQRVLAVFRSRFVGKVSPIHLFWGGLDLAVTRFSGRGAPSHPGGAPNCGPHVMLEAYSHEGQQRRLLARRRRTGRLLLLRLPGTARVPGVPGPARHGLLRHQARRVRPAVRNHRHRR